MPLLWISLAFVSGLVAASLISFGWLAWTVCLAACLALLLFLRQMLAHNPLFPPAWLRTLAPLAARSPLAAVPPLLLAAAVCAGGLRTALAHPPLTPADCAYYNDRGPLTITGVIDTPPTSSAGDWQVILRVEQIAPAPQGGSPILSQQASAGRVSARIRTSDALHYGDRLKLTGAPQAVLAGETSGQAALYRQRIYTSLYYPTAVRLAEGAGSPILMALDRLRRQSWLVLESIFPAPSSDLLQGILLGDDSGLPDELKNAFSRTGTSHILAISGFNISLLSGLIITFASKLLGRRRGAAAAALVIILYTLLVGAGASVVRAAIMGLIGLIGQQFGRRQAGLNSLAFTAALMSLLDPGAPWDVGFQLSFMATLGLILYAEPLETGFRRLAGRFLSPGWTNRLAGPAGEYVLFTLAAQATTLPLMMYYFQSFSPVTFLANPLLLPDQPPLMILGGLALLGGLVDLTVGRALALLAWPFSAYTIRVVTWLGAVPYASIPANVPGPGLLIMFYALLFGLTIPKIRTALFKALSPVILGILALSGITLLTWNAVLQRPDQRLHIYLFAGAANIQALIQTPDGQYAAINGSPPGAVADRLPFLRREVDLLLISSADAANLQAVSHLLQNVTAHQVLSALPDDPAAAALITKICGPYSLVPGALTPGQRINLGRGASLQTLPAAGQPAAFLLDWSNFRLLVSAASDRLALPQYLPAESISILALTGPPPENSQAVRLRGLSPLAWLFLLPGPQPPGEIPAAWHNLPVAQVAPDGWIHISTDGAQYWIETNR
jgi:competence protein ComEC